MDNKLNDKSQFKHKAARNNNFDEVLANSTAISEADYDTYLERLWTENPRVYSILKAAEDLETARNAMYRYLEEAERHVFDVDNQMHILEKATVRDCIKVFKSVIGPINERRTGVSALDCLWKLARNNSDELKHQVTVSFLTEFISLFRGVEGKSHIYFESEEGKEVPDFLRLEGRAAADARTEILDNMGAMVQKYLSRYPSGLDKEVISRREENRVRILKYFGGTEEDWNDYVWQLRHVIRNAAPLLDLIELSPEHQKAVQKAAKQGIPFGITPYYLSLIDQQASNGYDHAIRAQVIPPLDYVDVMTEHRKDRDTMFDFMGEHDTSPIDLITRRYPCIAILKPFNTCAQICVYCQRNWEIDEVLAPNAMAGDEQLQKALNWFDKHPSVGDVLITGGDPCVMENDKLREIIEILSRKEQVYRIRIGTRTPVVLPMRWNEDLIQILADAHKPGRREIAVVTHFEHSYEITPQAMQAVQKIRHAGISVYNQEVFTVENSRRFETAKLRKDLRSIGVDPYYIFNMKGKEEMHQYRVPIARILQESKEEARLLPGLDRTDEPVFNVPKLGKNYLRAGQHRQLVMIQPDGRRVYEFHPWEKNIAAVPPYYYNDVPIYEYLQEMSARGENISDYRTIWFYH